ncbi:ATP-binding protein [Actinoplanes sp. NPDC024001]|uniref:ATP-binding protein n=1 Tax=Actinoplanes sp. NPDC024001 TaxID=3154598 RepID=UPI003406CD21
MTLDVESSAITVVVHGDWGRHLQQATHVAIRKCLVEHPATLFLDLSYLSDPRAGSVTMWMGAGRRGEGMSPPVQVIACIPESSAISRRLRRLGSARFLPMFATLAQCRAAAAAAQRGPMTDRIKLRLSPDHRAAATARTAVSDACTAWQLPDLRYRARLVVSELVINAVEHAGTPITVVLSRRGTGLHAMVRDGDPRPPRLREPLPVSAGLSHQRGLGLRAVDAAATVWGAIPTQDGKAVWATIRPLTSVRRGSSDG